MRLLVSHAAERPVDKQTLLKWFLLGSLALTTLLTEV